MYKRHCLKSIVDGLFSILFLRNVAALPVTQQMTEMSISREDNVTSPNSESTEPGMPGADLKGSS